MTFLWKGPLVDGITQSMLSRFLVCRERFRLYAIKGFREIEEWDDGLEYGNLFHFCLEEKLAGRNWERSLRKYIRELHKTYPTNTDEVNKWSTLCLHQFKIYLEHLKKTDRRLAVPRRELAQEMKYDVFYDLPSGRRVRLRGMFDGIHVRGDSIYLEEHKTKSYIDEQGIAETLDFNFQTMFYHIVLREMVKQRTFVFPSKFFITGTQYNVIRRPLSSKYPIRQRKSETLAQFYKREASNIKNKPQEYFTNLRAVITSDKVEKFRQQCFDPLLQTISRWYDYMLSCDGNPWEEEGSQDLHYRSPWGIFNPMFGGFRGPYYDYLSKGHTGSLQDVDTLFRELQ